MCGGGAPALDVRGVGVPPPAFHGPLREDFPHLHQAFASWEAREFPRYVSQCLLALRLPSPNAKRVPEGVGFALSIGTAPMFVVIDEQLEQIAVESPLIVVPEVEEAAAFRAALELNAELPHGARICLRDRVLVLRFCDRLSRVPPPRLVHALSDVANGSPYVSTMLGFRFHAQRTLLSEAEAQLRGVNFMLRGEPRRLTVLSG